MPGEEIRVFLDASVFVAAAGSPTGGSSLVLAVCRGKRFAAATTQRVLREAQLNIRKKLAREALLTFYRELAFLNPELVEPVTEEEASQYEHIVAAKDAHVLAGGIKARAQFLLTLDRKHFRTQAVADAELPLTILTPGEFLAWLRKRYAKGTTGVYFAAHPSPRLTCAPAPERH